MGHKETKLLQGLASGNEGAESKLKKLWNQLDEKRKGQLDKTDAVKFFGMMHDYLAKHNKSIFDDYCSKLSKEDCIELWFTHFDTDGNGTISWQEFHETVNFVSDPEQFLKKVGGGDEKAASGSNSSGGDTLRLMLAGDSNVGKTALMIRFVDEDFKEEFVAPAQEASKTKAMKIKDTPVKLEICDTVGQERFKMLTATYFNQCNGVLIVFDLTNPSSFDRIPNWLKHVQHYSSGPPQILVGNKCDLTKEIKVSKEKIEAFCTENNLKYFETSAITGVGVSEAFINLSTMALHSKKSKKS